MKNGTCPKCGSDSVFCGDKVPLKSGPFASNSIPISLISIASLDNYVCADCGFIESYIAEKDKIKEVANSWRSVKESGATGDE